jgi:uncharacterized protein
MNKRVRVKPNAKTQQLIEEPDGSLTVHLKSSPVEGKANAELIQVLSKTFEVPKSAITIKLGLTSRQKLIEIDLEDN